MKSLAELIAERSLKKVEGRPTERGEFLKYFASKIGRPIGYVAMRLKGVPTTDLYEVKKTCDNYNGPWAKCFYGKLVIKK